MRLFKIFIILTILLVILFFFTENKKNKHIISIENYHHVCVLPPYAKEFKYPDIPKSFDSSIQKKLNTYLESIHKVRNSERTVSLIFSNYNYSSFAIIDDVLPSEFKSILGITYHGSYNGTCFKLKS